MIRLASVILALTLWPVHASADWHVTPFFGLIVGTNNNFVDLEDAAGSTKSVYGGSVSFLGRGPLGIEGDLGYIPGFFQQRGGILVSSSRVTTLMGNVLVSLPLQLTRESLRPYVVGGVGLMQVHIADVASAFDVDRAMLGFDVGAGVIGFVSPRTGIRLEVRHFHSLGNPEDGGGVGFGDPQLSFWRISAGIILRR